MSVALRTLALSAALATGGAATASAAAPPSAHPPAPVAPAPEPAPHEPAPGRAMAITGSVLIMASAGGYIAMAVGLGIGSNADADVRALGSVDEVDERRDVMARGRLGNRLAIGAGIAAAALMASGIALVVVGRRKASQSRTAVSWLPLPAGAGVQVGRRF